MGAGDSAETDPSAPLQGRFTRTTKDGPPTLYIDPVRTAVARMSLDADNRLRILVVDDEKSVRTSLIRMLNAHGHRAIGAGDGMEALQKAEDEHPDLILMDLLMPGQNGIETTRNLRNRVASARIPVIALSASPMRTDDQTLFQVVLAKPCSLADLLRAIDSVTPQKRASAAE